VRDASPVSYVRAGAPPFHIAHGTADRFVPAAQSEQFAEALSAVGVDVELTLVPEADHMWMGARDPDAIFDAAVGFARRVASS
jgi:dipeptidyl aminopeptidase/acylaminoacyl peptidase